MDREFDKKEKKEIRDTLDVILTDIRALYDESGSDELKATFSHPDSYHHRYNLCVKKKYDLFLLPRRY